MKKRDFIRTSSFLALGAFLAPSASCSNSAPQGDAAGAEDPMAGADGQFTLPELPYDHNALEPYIDKQTMMIHHGKHHAGYVRKLNKALEGQDVSGQSLKDILSSVEGSNAGVRNNGGGHYNHSLFWEVMSPGGGEGPTGNLKDALDSTFNSFDGFKEKFSNAAASRFGSGWAWLSVDGDGKLFVSSTPNQDNPLMPFAEQKGTPILGIDVWEHAYYLKYQNERTKYIANFFNIINWETVAANYAAIG